MYSLPKNWFAQMNGRTDPPSLCVKRGRVCTCVVHVSFIKCENCVPRKYCNTQYVHTYITYVHMQYIHTYIQYIKNTHSNIIVKLISHYYFC